jgi:hypothetical protein
MPLKTNTPKQQYGDANARKRKSRAIAAAKKVANKRISTTNNNTLRKQKSRQQKKTAVMEKYSKLMEHPSYLSATDKMEVINEFESQTKSIEMCHCKICHKIGMNMKMSKKLNESCCWHCSKLDPDYFVDNKLLLIWIDDKFKIQYHVPYQLQILTDAEKMLIQRLSPFIPLHHIKSGTLGIKGHCCCFEQNLQETCDVLPRLPSDVTVIKMIHTYKREISGEYGQRIFTVNKNRVLNALYWLKNRILSMLT